MTFLKGSPPCAVEVKNGFAALDLIVREPEELWKEMEAFVKDEAKHNIPKDRKPKKSKLAN